MKIRLDHKGIAQMLKSQPFAEAVHDLAERVAGNVVVDADVEVRDYTTDRAASSVTIAHPAGLAIQAKHGVLTKAAASVGLEVRSK